MPTHVATFALDIPTTPRLRLGVAQELPFPVRYGTAGALQAATAGSLTIRRPSGTDLVAGVSLDVSSSTPKYALAAPSINPAVNPSGYGWQYIVSLTIGGVVYGPWSIDVIAVLEAAHPVVSEATLFVREPELAHRYPEGQTSWQPQVSAAWEDLVRAEDEAGQSLDLNRNPTATADAHLFHGLELCCEALNNGADANRGWAFKAANYREQYKQALSRLRPRLVADPSTLRRGRGPMRLAPTGRPQC